MFTTIEYLKLGTDKQRRAYHVICQLGIMKDLAAYTPVLCGTIPLRIDLPNSDLDIIMEVSDFEHFQQQATMLYGKNELFTLKRLTIREIPVIKANFFFQGFEFELFGQPQPVHKQYAYLHMVIQHRLLETIPSLREQIILLKKQGYKTEPAFCMILGLEGDSYEKLLEYGKEKGIIAE